MGKKRIRLLISGRVQGVFFRDNTRKKAKEFGLKGWVKNLENGQVEIVAEGQEEDIESLIQWAKKGPLLARVDDLKVKEEQCKEEFNYFEIKR